MPTYTVKFSNFNLSQKQKNSLAKDISNTQKVFNHRAKMNSLAALGKWSEDLDSIKL